MAWTWNNIDWNATGAMVQAVGSVGAILAAIWIDQGTSRRHRTAREEENRRARAARIRCLENCADTLGFLADQIGGVELTSGMHVKPSAQARIALIASRDLVVAYQTTSWEDDPRVLVGLSHARVIMDEACERLPAGVVIQHWDQEKFCASFRNAAADVREIVQLTGTAEV